MLTFLGRRDWVHKALFRYVDGRSEAMREARWDLWDGIDRSVWEYMGKMEEEMGLYGNHKIRVWEPITWATGVLIIIIRLSAINRKEYARRYE